MSSMTVQREKQSRPPRADSAPKPETTHRQRFLDACACRATDRPPGRALPEYRKLKEKYTFVELVQSPELACEVTLQPVRRFGFDAAILFSDILVVPHALGQKVAFVAGEGPLLDPLIDGDAVRRLREQLDHDRLAPIYETIGLAKNALPPGVALL